MKSALFVDFDNIYSGLRQLDQTSADRFARRPMEWMNWVVKSLALPDHVDADAKRRVLVRRCYLNPQVYQRFRPFFNLAGFEIIDCPALTTNGKTSTDIHMVLDIIDLLQHEAHYDEFIVFSADADFTPVLRKLRRWDRRTTVLAIGFPSAAYRASADLVIDQDEFVRGALGILDMDEGAPLEPPSREPDNVGAALAIVRAAVAKSSVPVPLAALAGEILAKGEGIDAATWAGYGSFLALVQANNLQPLLISRHAGGLIYDPERHAAPEAAVTDAPSSVQMLENVTELIQREVKASREPIPCAKIATLVSRAFASLATDWNGKGTFRRFLESLSLAPIVLDWRPSGGYLYDPARHAVGAKGTESQQADEWADDYQTLVIAKQIHEVTGAPLLSPKRYRTLFEIVVNEANTNSFDFNESGKRIRDRCRDCQCPVSRSDVTFVLRGLLFREYKFDDKTHTVKEVSQAFANNVRSLCLREQIVLDQATEAAIRRWVEGRE